MRISDLKVCSGRVPLAIALGSPIPNKLKWLGPWGEALVHIFVFYDFDGDIAHAPLFVSFIGPDMKSLDICGPYEVPRLAATLIELNSTTPPQKALTRKYTFPQPGPYKIRAWIEGHPDDGFREFDLLLEA